MAQRAVLHVTLVTAQRRLYDGPAEMVNAPGGDGQLGILPRHAPLLTTLKSGELRVRNGGVDESIFVSGGFLEVNDNVVTILADDAERASDIDEEAAQEARRRAQALLDDRQGGEAQIDAQIALDRAVGRLRVAESHRQRSGRRRALPEQQELGQ
ncbi:MAG TPA: F0F1 ATP synthase subunit epsilon [Ktedonobacterales bacterium]|nr:F0F1 ATP synthase subunit epsilon [Ktedonobacterales bacterium]